MLSPPSFLLLLTLCVLYRSKGSGRLGERMKERERDRQTDRQTGRQADRQTDRQTGRQAGRQTDRQRQKQTDRQTDRDCIKQSAGDDTPMMLMAVIKPNKKQRMRKKQSVTQGTLRCRTGSVEVGWRSLRCSLQTPNCSHEAEEDRQMEAVL